MKVLRGNKVLASGKDVYLGIDVHKENWHVTALKEGEEVFSGRIPGNYKVLKRLLAHFEDCKIHVAYEAGPFGFWLYDELINDGIEAIVVSPSLIPTESGNRVKTDKRDSRKLARLLESNMLKRVYVLTEEERVHRELLRTRRQLVKHRGSVARQIKSKLLFHGISSPFPDNHAWSRKYIAWLRGLTLQSEYFKESLDVLIDLYEHLTRQIIRMNKRVVELSRTDKYAHRIRLIRSIPGIGLLTGMEILVELQDVKRFKTSEEIASYMGLTPSEYSTGEYVHQGRITRCGNRRVRTALVESSWILITKDPYMRYKYMKLKSSKGSKKAIIAIARRLIIRVRSVLLNNTPYVIGTPVLHAA